MAGPVRILLVDDESMLLEVGKLFLEEDGEFAVDTLTSAKAALEQLKTEQYNAIISDYQMPGMDGITFLKTLKASGNTTPFIIFTGRSREEIVIQALNEGAAFYLQKGGEPNAMFAELRHKIRQVVEKRRAEQDLREREATLASIFRAAPTGIGMVINRVIVKVNDRLSEITGYKAEELLGKSARILYPTDEDFDYVGREKYEQIRKSGTGTVETRWQKKDGSIRDILLSSTPLDPSDPAKGVTFTALDITGQKNAGLALRESEQLLRDIIEKNPMSIQIVDREGLTLSVNPAFMRLFGSVPPPDYSIITDLVKCNPELETLISRVKSGEAVNLPDMRFNPPDIYPELPDVPTRVRAIIFPLHDRYGKPERFVFMHENITGQKLAEEALLGSRRILEAVIDNVPARVFWKDTNLTYLGCNTAFARDAGYEKPEYVVGKDDYAMGWRNQAELYRADDRHVIESGNAKLFIEEPQTTPTGEQISLLTSKVPLRDEAGKIIGVLGTYIDVTERKRAAEELKESESSYRGLFNSIRQALYLLDHEGKFVDVNFGAEQMYGYAREEFVGRTPEFLSAPGKNDLAAVAGRIQKAFTGEPQKFEFWGLRKNGEVFPKEVHISRSTYFGEDVVLAIGSDITERKLAENALRESENKFSIMFHSNPVPMTLVSAIEGTFTDVNDAFLFQTGYTREDVISRSSGELGLFSDRDEYEQMVSLLRSRSRVEGIEMHTRRKNGEGGTCLFSSAIILMGDRPYILSTVQDITDRKSADLAFQTMTTGMVGTTGLGSLDRITESISSWLGADCIMVGEILPDRKRVKVLSMLLDGKKVDDFSYSLKGTPCENTAEKGFCLYPDNAASLFPNSRDMQELTIRGYAGTPLKDADGRTIGILCILTRKPLVLPPEGRKILDIIAVKAAAEIGRKQSEERLTRINEALLNLGTDSQKNIGNLTRLCGELLNADCILYNRLDEGLLCVIGQWNCPPDLPAHDSPEGHICFDVIRKDGDGPLVVCDLQNSRYATSDPNVATYGLKTYIGHPVRYGGIIRGSLCAVYTRDFTPATEDLEIIGILSSAVAQEEERREADQALRESEADFRDFFNNTGDAIVIHDMQGRFLEVNDEICRRLGYTREELLAMSPRDIDEPEYGSQVQDRLTTLQQAGHTVFETIHRRKDGILIPTEVSSRRITYRGKPAVISTGRDITERKRAGEALARVNQKLSLLSGITRHDIKNQLLGLNGFLALSKQYLGDAATMSEFITKEEKITQTIEQQIAFAREYEAIGVKAPVWQDCRSLVDAAALHIPPGNGIVENDIPSGLEVFADPLMVKALYNLIDNAVRHGGNIAAIRFSVDNRNGDPVVVCEDDGTGVPADEKEHIFERGFGKNTGLGLFLSREILAITGITMTETGEPGKGARFEMAVPKGAWRAGGKGA